MDDTQAPLPPETAVYVPDKLISHASRRVLSAWAGLGCALLAPLAAHAQNSSVAQPYDGTSFSNPYAPGGPYDPYRYEHLGRDSYGLYGGAAGTVPGAPKTTTGAHALSRLQKEKKLMGVVQSNAPPGISGSTDAGNPLNPPKSMSSGLAATNPCGWPAQPPAFSSASGGATPQPSPDALLKGKGNNNDCSTSLGALSSVRSRSK